jgi:hypothetical protein
MPATSAFHQIIMRIIRHADYKNARSMPAADGDKIHCPKPEFLAIAVTIWRFAAQRSFYRPRIKITRRYVFEPS